MNVHSFLKEWYTLDEINNFIKNTLQITIPKKFLLKQLYEGKLADFSIYLKGGEHYGKIEIGTLEYKEVKIFFQEPFKDYAGYDEEGSYQQLERFVKQQKKAKIEGSSIQILIEYDEKNDKLISPSFEGFFVIPHIVFFDENFLFSGDDSLFLPASSFYQSLELVTNPANEKSSYNFSFLTLEFNHIKEQVFFKLDDVRIEFHINHFGEVIDYFKKQLSPPTAPAKTVKNKSNKKAENPTDKKTIITHFVLESVKATAEANKHCGGYQIINAVIEAMIEKQGYRKNDFLTPEAYLKKVKKAPYHLTFPKNSGRYKADQKPLINVILTA